jgi:subtilisin
MDLEKSQYFKTGYEEFPNLSGTPFAQFTPEWAWGGATGKGIKVAVIDSGVDASHPALENSVREHVEIVSDGEKTKVVKCGPEDAFGHGTACAGIIHSIAPEAEIYSVKVLGSMLRSTGEMFIAGLKWVIDQNIPLANLSLGTTREKYFSSLHSLTDRAYFNRLIMVAARSNAPAPSFPATFSSIIGVKAIYTPDPFDFYFADTPPVEFLVKGVDVKLPWLNHQWEKCTGNSFAAPHLTGIIALIMSKHPYLTPFMVKSILYSIAVQRGRYGK